jgi:hypothetical protein
MVGWIKKLFTRKESVSVPCNPSQETTDEVVTPDPEGIEEPVLSFVECFMDNPRRFKIIPKEDSTRVVDKVGGAEYEVWFLYNCIIGRICVGLTVNGVDHLESFSKKELDYVANQLETFYKERKLRLQGIRKTRLRNRLSRVYCNAK